MIYAIKYGPDVVWPGGYSRRLTWRERIRWHLGRLKMVSP
jgi:hypothetical protein